MATREKDERASSTIRTGRIGGAQRETAPAGSGAKIGGTSQTVSRALAILRVFDRDRRELGVTEIGEILGLPKTIAFRLIQTLRQHDFLEQNPETLKYRIGIGAFEVGSLFKGSTFEAEAAPFMRRLVDDTGYTAQLAVLHDIDMVIIARMEGHGPLRYGVSVGERRPLHSSAVGKAALSALPESRVDALLDRARLEKRTPNTITDRRRLGIQLAEIRAQGYAVNWEEHTVGVASIAAPVASVRDHTIGALALAFPANAAAKKQLRQSCELVRAAAQALSARI